MTMETIMSFILEGGYIMIPMLWFLGFIIGNTKKIENCYIPFILLPISIGITPLLMGGYNPMNIVQAILVVGGATLIHETGESGTKIVKGE